MVTPLRVNSGHPSQESDVCQLFYRCVLVINPTSHGAGRLPQAHSWEVTDVQVFFQLFGLQGVGVFPYTRLLLLIAWSGKACASIYFLILQPENPEAQALKRL